MLFPGPSGRQYRAWVPPGFSTGTFRVLVQANGVFQPIAVPLPSDGSVTAGYTVKVKGVAGRIESFVVPPNVLPGETFVGMMSVPQPLSAPRGELLSGPALQVWLDCARKFQMNCDFEVHGCDHLPHDDYDALMSVMKECSDDKLTIQAMADKILMGQLIANMDIAQLPVILAVRDPASVKAEVSALVDQHLTKVSDVEVIVKPTHLSSGEGVFTVRTVQEAYRDSSIDEIVAQIQSFLERCAHETESAALRSLLPGCIAQPKYKSFNDGKNPPIELRVTALWGRAHSAVWWWGDTALEMNTWFARREGTENEWDELHEGIEEPGLREVRAQMLAHMPALATAAEKVAVAVGAPFLRSDFFIGSDEFGVRLNETAYGSNIQYRRQNTVGNVGLLDDAPVVAQVLHEGMPLCSARFPAKHFLSQLGFSGSCYRDAIVLDLKSENRPELANDGPETLVNVPSQASAPLELPMPLAMKDCEDMLSRIASAARLHNVQRWSAGAAMGA